MAISTSGLMTWEEFERTPEWAGKQELLQGELIELPPAKKKHNVVAQEIFLAIHGYLKQASLGETVGKAYHEMGYRVTRNPDSWFIPDASIAQPNQRGDDYFEGAPLLAVEVISQSNLPRHIAKKVTLYLENGSREVWVVDPGDRRVKVHRKTGVTSVEGALTTDFLPGFSLDLPTLFAD